MGEAGRKLTIRMPDNPRLRSAEVAQVHLDPGAVVRVGSPVMTLIARRREHMVRAPRPGRVIPLVANGDQVQPGDPLYVLNIDERALAEAKRSSRELVTVEKAKWSAGITPDVIEPMMRSREEAAAQRSGLSGMLAAWAKPALAVALYILACFALLPILNAVGRDASMPVLAAMCVGSVLFAALIYHLYAPDGGIWPRWTVRLVAFSWIGISAMAIFYRPDNPEDITLADAAADVAAPLAGLFAPGEAGPQPAPGPADAPVPVLAAASGIAAGPPEARVVPDWTVPLSVLGAAAPVPPPHGLEVRTWARFNPTNDAGEPLGFAQADRVGDGLVPDDGAAVTLAAAPGAPGAAGAVPGALAAAPDLAVLFADAAAEAAAEAEAAAYAARPTPVLPVLGPPAVDPGAEGLALAALAPAGGQAVPVAPLAAPEGAETAVAVAVPARAETWLSEIALPVLQGVPAAPALDEASPAPAAAARMSLAMAGPAPDPLTAGATPDLLRAGLARTTDDAWMAEQLALAKDDGPAPPASARDQTMAAERRAPALAGPGGAAPTADAPVWTAPGALAVLKGELGQVRAAEDDVRVAGIAPAPAAARMMQDLGAAQPVPAAAPAPPPWQPAPAPAAAERLLVFLFYDDPRLTDLPGPGDAWMAEVSPGLAADIRSSTVEAVSEIIEVTNWCAAANDPDGRKERFLPGGAYRTAQLGDRIRLLQVRVALAPGAVDALEAELPVFDGKPAGFFHNRMPLMGGAPGEAVLSRAEAYLTAQSNRTADPNTPPGMDGGKYFASAEALAASMQASGCRHAIWNRGDGPSNAIGRRLAAKIAG